MLKKRLPAIAGRVAWEKVTQGSWNKVAKLSRESMEGYRRKPRRDTVHREVWGYKTEVKEMIEIRKRLALRNKGEEEEHLEI